jgi:hypothetical protein
MDPDPPRQLEIDFASQQGGQGYTQWQASRRAALGELARKLGLPLGRGVEVRLRDGVVLRGQLSLCEEQLFIEPKRDFRLELRIGRATFAAGDIESCVRLD